MTSYSDIAVNGNRMTSKTVDGIECIVAGNEKLGSLMGIKGIQTATIMYVDTIIQFIDGLQKIRADKPLRQWKKCPNNIHVVKCNCPMWKCNHNKEGCGYIIKTPKAIKRTNGSHIVGAIPYATKQPRYSIVEQILYIQKDNGLRWKD